MPKYDNVNTPVIAAVGLLAVLGLVAFVLLLQIVYYQAETQQEYEKIIAQPDVELDNLKTQQQGKLASYAWVNEKQKVVAIPIDRAMDLVLDDLKHGRRPPEAEAAPAGDGKGAEHGKP